MSASSSWRTPFKCDAEVAVVVLSPKNVRRIGPDHSKYVERFVTSFSRRLFGDIDVEELLNKCYVSIGLDDEKGKLVAAMCLRVYPNIPALPPWEWEHWLNNIYGLSCDSRNSLWVHLIVWDEKYSTIFMKPMLAYLFKHNLYLENFFLCLPPGTLRIDFLEEHGTRIIPKNCRNPKSMQTMYRVTREKYVLHYKIRGAVEEDNDDLVPLIDRYSKELVANYGEYYIAEILTRHKDCGRHIIVAEYDGCAVGVMVLNEAVNYELLNTEFELAPFNGFRQQNESDDLLETMEQNPIDEDIVERSSQTDIPDFKIYTTQENSPRTSEELLYVSSSSSEYSLVFTTSSAFLFQDDDEVPIVLDEPDGPGDSRTSYEILEQYNTIHDADPRLTYVDILERLSKCNEMFTDSVMDSAKGKPSRIPHYHGDPNAFTLEVAAAHPDHEACLALILESVFQCFPERDYCLMSIPSEIPNENITNYFVRVIPRPTGSFPYELYACHKNGLHTKVRLKTAKSFHMPQVQNFLQSVPNHETIICQFESFVSEPETPYSAYVLLSDDVVVGTAVVSEEIDIDFIEAHYELLPWINTKRHKRGSYGVIENIVVAIIFQNHSKYFLRELHRLSDYEVLFYKHRPFESKTSYRDRPLLNLLHWLVPILPRTTPEYDMDLLIEEGYPPHESVTRTCDVAFALYLSATNLCSMVRYPINTKIVVFGGSNTALAFLEGLTCFRRNPNYMVIFNNVTLVCPKVMAPNMNVTKNKKAEMFVVQKYFINDPKYVDQINLKAYVNMVNGSMTEINRKERHIIVNGTSLINYDLLFLMAGERFQKPLKDNIRSFSENPENMFLINSAMDATLAVQQLRQIHTRYRQNKDMIIVYGHFLQAHCCLAALLACGIPGHHLVFVEQFPYTVNIDKKRRHSISVYNDPEIYRAVMDHIREEYVTVYSSYFFIDWEYDSDTNMITKAKFESKHKMLALGCKAIFFFYEKSISPKLYKVINDAGLVFDGRLVIDSTCRTNDERIYAAGTLTKYSRKYYASNMTHKYFNRVEIGHKLAQQIKISLLPPYIKKFQRKIVGWNFHIDSRDRLVPRYEKPIMRYCRLPGGLFYLSIVKPGKMVPLETSSSWENYGQVFITGNCRNLRNQGFFRLHLNEFNRVETITCLTKFPIDIRNLYCIWGKHEKLLNNMQLRFEMVLITDLFEYFKEPWTYALYHDRFDTLLSHLNNLMTSSVGQAEDCIITELIEMYKERKWRHLSPDQIDELDEKFPSMLFPQIIEQKVLDFIRENLTHLPMYAHPDVVREILEGFDNSPLFK